MSIENRPEFKAARIQAEADSETYGMSPERLAEREKWREKIAGYIGNVIPMRINLDNLTDDDDLPPAA